MKATAAASSTPTLRRLRLYGDELVGAGMDGPGSIPPVRGAAIEIGRGGNGRGKVTGLVVGSSMSRTREHGLLDPGALAL